METAEIHTEFQRILVDFQREILPVLRENLAMQDYRASGMLYNDLEINLQEGKDQQWELALHMPEYGRILDKKRPFAASASIEDLTKWISYVGLDKFRSIPGYDDSNFIPANAAERIAWGIKMSKPKQANRYRSFNNPIEWQWFYRPFFGEWAEARNVLLNVYFDKVPEMIKNEVARTYQSAVSALGKPTSR